MYMPYPIRLFHITAIDNLADICNNAKIFSKNQLVNNHLYYSNIAHASCQNTRSRKPVCNNFFYGTIHDYVPFYFAPRSPMLYAINGGKVENCNFSQKDIIHFEFLLTLVNRTNIANRFVFYDRNATSAGANAYTEIDKLYTAINWQLILEPPTLDGYCKDFYDNESYPNRRQQRQAEFLIKDQVPLTWFARIGVADKQAWQKVVSTLQQYNINLNVEIKTDWYFLGQR